MNKYTLFFLSSTYLILVSLLNIGVASAASSRQQSSYELMSAENKAMQDDPSLNPAMFWVGDGEALWQQKMGPQNKACSSCHGDVKKSMRGVATQFPKVINRKLQTLEGQINQCRVSNQSSPPLAY